MLAKARNHSCLQKHLVLKFEEEYSLQNLRKKTQENDSQCSTISAKFRQNSGQIRKIQLKANQPSNKKQINSLRWNKCWLKTSYGKKTQRKFINPDNSNFLKVKELKSNKLRWSSLKQLKQKKSQKEIKQIWGQITYRSSKKLIDRMMEQCNIAKQITQIVSESKNYYENISHQIINKTQRKFHLKKFHIAKNKMHL